MGWHRSWYLVLLLSLACDRATAPRTPGVLTVTTSTNGLDAGPYAVTVDGKPLRAMAPNDSVTVSGLAAGNHTVMLSEIAANCTLQGPNSRVANVADNAISPVVFNVTCVAKTGFLQVTTLTMGIDQPGYYALTIDDVPATSIAAIETRLIAEVAGGDHVVSLAYVPSSCTVDGGSSRNVSVVVGGMTRDTARLAFTVSCTSMTGVIEIALKASGFDYGDAFSVAIGNAAPREITPNSITRVAVPVGQYAVKLAQIPETCTVSGSDSTLLGIATSAVKRDTARAGFQLACTGAELIAFSRGTDLFIMRPDGSRAKRITTGIQPAWSADGARLAFVRSFCEEYYYCDSGLAVFDYRSIAGSVSSLTNESDSSPAWSPNGATVAFVRDNALFQVKPDGTGLAPIPTSTFVTSDVAWSPDGARLAFGCRGQDEDFDDICVINKDGTGLARLTAEGRFNSDPAWSPDGTQIAFVRVDYQTQRDSRPLPYVALMQSDGSNVRRVASGTSPAWSRDGRRIVFTNSVQPGLATIKPDGTALTQITTNPDDDAPSWRP
jgi:hypothetical protein